MNHSIPARSFTAPKTMGLHAIGSIGAVLAFTGLLVFVGLTVATVFFGRSNAGKPMEAW